MKTINCILVAFAMAQLATPTTAFVAPASPLSPITQHHHHGATPTLPSPSRSTSTELALFSRRREVFKNLKQLLFTGTMVSGFHKEAALAEESATVGRIVEFQMNNLDGEAGKMGTIKIQLRPEWAPRGVARFEELTTANFFDECRVFRVLPGFVSQFGINGNPSTQAKWRSNSIPDDPVKVSNKRGTIVFATGGPNTRTSQIFVNTREQGNDFLDKQGFAPIGQVIEGMDLVDKFYAGYGEGAPAGKGPNQGLIQMKGNSYLEQSYPKLSYISKASFAK